MIVRFRRDMISEERGFDRRLALARAAENEWTIISMRNDWTRVFPDAVTG